MTGLNKIIIILSTLRKIANLIVQVEIFEVVDAQLLNEKTNSFADRGLCKIYMTHKEKIYFTFWGHY